MYNKYIMIGFCIFFMGCGTTAFVQNSCKVVQDNTGSTIICPNGSASHVSNGKEGDQGATGASGLNGNSGVQGNTGPSGVRGTMGVTGASGPTGTSCTVSVTKNGVELACGDTVVQICDNNERCHFTVKGEEN